MSYVFDNSPFSVLFKNFYRTTFPNLWKRFDELVTGGGITSTREVLREFEDGATVSLRDWAAQHPQLFTTPTATEGAFVAQIYGVTHFQQNIELQKILKGGRNADPFVVAKAHVEGGTVVTMELLKPTESKFQISASILELSALRFKSLWTPRDGLFRNTLTIEC